MPALSCRHCRRSDAWESRTPVWQSLVAAILPLRRRHCLACGKRQWRLSEGLLELLIPAALWAALAIASGWAAGRHGLEATVSRLASRPSGPPGDTAPGAFQPPAASQQRGDPRTSAAISPASELAVLLPLWVQSWAERRVEEYLTLYSEEFSPSDGRTLEEWRTDQRQALEGAQAVRVELSALVVEPEGENSARVFLTRTYPASGGSVSVESRLHLVRRNGQWRILGEDSEVLGSTALPGRTPETEYPGGD